MLCVKYNLNVGRSLLQLCSTDISYGSVCCFKQQVSRNHDQSKLDPKVLALRSKLVFCDYLDSEKVNVGYVKRRIKELRLDRYNKQLKIHKFLTTTTYSVLVNEDVQKDSPVCSQDREEEQPDSHKPIYMPYANTDHYETIDTKSSYNTDVDSKQLNAEYMALYEKYLEAKEATEEAKRKLHFDDYVAENLSKLQKDELSKVPSNWMTDFEQFNDGLLQEGEHNYFGTPNPSTVVSSVPCGGCGALLHCKDPAIPGYLPSELYMGADDIKKKSLICQRCHFLKVYNAALDVKVSPEEYPELLNVIKSKKCAVILMIDLTDLPCSIWPRISSILNPLTPVFLVGNKVDLLPRDSKKCLNDVKMELVKNVHSITGIRREMIAHVALISAKTGYGVENLINKLQYKWAHKGDVYLIGCTNVGKSSLFNALLRSDYCKVQAADFVQRATISPWPGTTLNTLKFPILNPVGKKMFQRYERLNAEQPLMRMKQNLRNEKFSRSRNPKLATLRGYIGRTFQKNIVQDVNDPFSEKSHKAIVPTIGIDETKSVYQHSRWCYDTPGTMHYDQVLDLLTTDELMATLPNQIITPRTFVFQPEQTFFLAGMGRLDYLEGDDFIRCTLFASKQLPITICNTVDANEIYKELLCTKAFVVPGNDPERLKLWPPLESTYFTVTGIRKRESAGDVVLSSAGWVSITPTEGQRVTLRAWTPQARGIYLRIPSLLRYSVKLRGDRISNTPMYKPGLVMIP